MSTFFCVILVFVSQLSWGVGVGGRGGTGGGDEKKPLSIGCVEGSIGEISIYKKDSVEHSGARVCRNGSYMTDAERSAYIYNPSPKICQEGSYRSFSRKTDEGVRNEVSVCRQNRWYLYREY